MKCKLFLIYLVISLFDNFVLCSGYFSCFCNVGHMALTIFNCPNQNGDPIGFMYRADHLPEDPKAELISPHCKPDLNVINAAYGWKAIPHYDQVGYILLDSGVEQRICMGSRNFTIANLFQSVQCPIITNGGAYLATSPSTTPSTVKATTTTTPKTTKRTTPTTTTSSTTTTTPTPTTTTTPTKTTMPTTTTTATTTTASTTLPTTKTTNKWISVSNALNFIWVTPPSQQVDCDGRMLDMAASTHYMSRHNLARRCPGVTLASRDESVLMEFCNAPEVYKWTKGLQVLSNCRSIPKYTPIALFKGGTMQNGEGAGVFIECTQKSIKIARQTCAIQAVEIVELPPFVAIYYHTLTW